jgi:propanol-preferring alcohol dehydrogenase
MKAAVVQKFGRPLVIEDRPIPEPGPGQITVKMEASGLCHTDIHAAHGDWPVKPVPPFVPGHEGVGIVDAVGAGVTRLRVGERVAVPWLGYACGSCRSCLTGWETLCEKQLNTGYSVDGCYAEYFLAEAAGRAADPGHLPGAGSGRGERGHGSGPAGARPGPSGPAAVAGRGRRQPGFSEQDDAHV